MAWLDDLRVLVEGASVATFGTNLFISTKAVIPPGDGPYLTIAATGGSGVEYVQNQKAPALEYESAQFVARASTFPAAQAMAQAAYDAVVSISNEYVNTTVFYLWIKPIQSPFDLGVDDEKRARVAFNIMALKSVN